MKRGLSESFIVDFTLRQCSLNGTWRPDEAEREAAWELLVELSTRTSMSDLDDDQGTARAALSSLYTLFDTTRSILRTHGAAVARSKGDGNLSFGVIAVRILNDVLRALLSEWHPLPEQYEHERPADWGAVEWERSWEHSGDRRHAIAGIRPVIRQYVLVLAEAADVPELANAVLVPNGGPSRATTGPGLFAGLGAHHLGLGFRPQIQMVRWFGPPMLANTALKIARMKLGKLDARRDMVPAPGPTLDHALLDHALLDHAALDRAKGSSWPESPRPACRAGRC